MNGFAWLNSIVWVTAAYIFQTLLSLVESLENKQKCKFIKFPVVKFYPSISESLLQKALNFAQKFTEIDRELIYLIMHSRKSVLFEPNQVWVKKRGNLFDVTMGSFNGAEICELADLYLLHNLLFMIYHRTQNSACTTTMA